MKFKYGPARRYSTAELEHFARFRGERAPFTPTKCHGDDNRLCWLELGPPAITPSGKCLGCGGTPKIRATRGRPTGQFQ